jgi:hypothetical protein
MGEVSRSASRFRVGLPIRVKTAILFVAIALLPTALVAGWLTRLADALALAANQGKDDEDGLDIVRAIVGSRQHLDAVRFEVPAVGVSTLIRRRDSVKSTCRVQQLSCGAVRTNSRWRSRLTMTGRGW